MQRRTNAAFAWDILKSDFKLLGYPLMRIVAMLVLLAVMWPLMFDISALEVGTNLGNIANQGIQDSMQTDGGGDTSSQNGQAQDDPVVDANVKNIVQHMNFGWFLLFLVINLFVGIFSTGALTGQSLAVLRGQHKGFGYGYARALLRFPQLFLWWLVTMVVGVLLTALENQRVIGLIIGGLIGFAWSILTFFSVTAIMDTGCGPFGAIGKSKKTITDAWHKIRGGTETSGLSTIRRGFYIGGPFAIINVILVLALIGLAFLDFRSATHGGHHISLGGFGAILIILYINGAFMSAMWAVVKSTIYLWAEEGTLPETVDESVMEKAFYQRGSLGRT
jgi:hypothetical protein